MKTIKLKLYAYSELSDKAKERALRDWNENNDDPLMQSHMINLLKEKLEEAHIKYDTDSIDVRYSLSYSQGDGFMFVGNITYKGTEIRIVQSDTHYQHSHTASFIYPENEDGKILASESKQMAFEKKYHALCKEMEQIGYDHIEYVQSEEAFSEVCEANNYTFEANGSMRNV